MTTDALDPLALEKAELAVLNELRQGVTDAPHNLETGITAYLAALPDKHSGLVGELEILAVNLFSVAKRENKNGNEELSKIIEHTSDKLREAAAALRAGGGAAAQGVRYRHFKGGFYTLISGGIFVSNLLPVVIYRAENDGTVYVRSRAEFYDGRFTAVAPLPAAPATKEPTAQ